jgi:tight adherence protein C
MMAHLATGVSRPVLFAAGAGWLLLLIGAAFLLRLTDTQRRLRRRIAHASGVVQSASDTRRTVVRSLPMAVLTSLGRVIAQSGLVPARTLDELKETLIASGFRGSDGLWLFIGAKIAGFVGLPLVALFALPHVGGAGTTRVAMLGGAAAIGLLGPDMIIRRIRTSYLFRLERHVPDALDLLVICAQAGLGLEAAIDRVADEMRESHREIAREFALAAHELQISADTRQALVGIGVRTGLNSLKRLGATLSQSLQYGTPLSAALRTLSAEMRQEMLTRFEERAARLPVLLTIPMVVFILPCFFIIVAGPAVIAIMHAFGHH